MDMTLPEFYLWTYVATKNMVEEAEALGIQVAQALMPMFKVMLGAN